MNQLFTSREIDMTTVDVSALDFAGSGMNYRTYLVKDKWTFFIFRSVP